MGNILSSSDYKEILKNINSELSDCYGAWEDKYSAETIEDEDCIYLISVIRKLEMSKSRIIIEHPELL